MDEQEIVIHRHELDDFFDSEEKKKQYLEIRERMRNFRNGTGPRPVLTPQELDIVTLPTFLKRHAETNREYFKVLREKRANGGQIDRKIVCTMVDN